MSPKPSSSGTKEISCVTKRKCHSICLISFSVCQWHRNPNLVNLGFQIGINFAISAYEMLTLNRRCTAVVRQMELSPIMVMKIENCIGRQAIITNDHDIGFIPPLTPYSV
jgi:hypothetical protein